MPPGRDEAWVWDSEVKGLGVRLRRNAAGLVTRTYVIRYGTGRRGKGKTPHIGQHGQPWRPDPVSGAARILGTELAREEAIRLLGMRAEGKDPAAARAGPRGMPTLREFALEPGTKERPRYLTDYVDVEKAPASAVADRGNIENHLLPLFGDVRLDLFGAEHFTALKRALRDTPVAANRCRSLLSHILNQARIWRYVPGDFVNPARDVKRFPEHGRQRILSLQELARVGPATQVEEDAALATGNRVALVAIAAIRVLMFSGARPVEIVNLRRAQLRGLGEGVIMQTSLKSKRKRRPIYLSPLAGDVIVNLWPRPWPKGGSEWVFPGRLRARDQALTVSAIDGIWERIRKRARVVDVRLYDAARHTFLTMTMLLAKAPQIVQNLAGHSDPRTTNKYIHLAADPLLRASGATAGAIDRALRGESEDDER